MLESVKISAYLLKAWIITAFSVYKHKFYLYNPCLTKHDRKRSSHSYQDSNDGIQLGMKAIPLANRIFKSVSIV